MTDSISPRRGFLARLSAAAFAVAATPAAALAARPDAEVDESWLRGLNGKHKQFFDVGTHRDGRPLGRVANFLDVYAEVYGLRDPDLNAVVGIHGPAIPLAFTDALWAKYDLGKRAAVNDPLTKSPATRNPFAKRDAADSSPVDASIATLQNRGVRFIACMRSIRGWSLEIAGSRDAAPAVNADLLAGLLPGITPVPAMIVAINRAQETGLTYVFA